MFLPVPEPLMRRANEHFAAEEMEALPLKERANELYQAKKFEEALALYTKALHCFSIRNITLDKMKHGLLLGTIVGSNSPVEILGGAAPQLARRIASFLVTRPYFFYRLPAVISGNISIVLRAMNRPGAWEAARRSLLFDPSYTKALGLMQKAAVDPRSPLPIHVRSALASSLKQKEQAVQLMAEAISPHVGILMTGLLPDAIDFAILEQARAYKELETIMTSDAYLNHPSQPSPKHVFLSLSLVPFTGADKTEGQWLLITLGFLDVSFRPNPRFINTIPEISHLHFCRADPENGSDAEAPPYGKASPRAVALVLERVPVVARILKEHWGLDVKRIRCGQGLVNLTGPNGPDESFEFGVGPTGLPRILPSVEARAGPAREFREMDLGPDTERLWGVWDDFARNMIVLPSHSTYAQEKAAGLA